MPKTEKVPLYLESFTAIKAQMMDNSQLRKEHTEEEIDVMIKQALIEKAKDKIEYSLRASLRRGGLNKYNQRRSLIGEEPMDEQEYAEIWKKRMKARLRKDGYPFELNKVEKELLKKVLMKKKKEAAEEITKTTAEALKKILTTI